MNTANYSTEPAPENLVQALVYGWNRFWFRPADPTPLALVRIAAGLVILYIHFCYCYDLIAFFGPNAWGDLPAVKYVRDNIPNARPPSDRWQDLPDYRPPSQTDPVRAEREKQELLRWDGMHPDVVDSHGYYAWSIFFHVTDPTWIWIIHIAHLVIFFLLTIGFCTRIVSVLAWLAAMSYIQRSPLTLYGQDTMLNFVLMYLMVGPCGAALSVDRLIERYARTWRVLRARGSSRKGGSLRPDEDTLTLDRPTPSISASLALRLLQIHICIVYLASGLSKLQGGSWWQGTAIWFTMANPEFSPVHWKPYRDVLVYLCQHRYLWEIVMNTTSVLTLVFEVGFAFLIWNHWLRGPMIVGSLMLHTGIAFFMGLTTFSLIMVCAVLSFVPLRAIHEFIDWIGRGRARFRLAFAIHDRKQVRAASLVHALDAWDQIELDDGLPPRSRQNGAAEPMLAKNEPAQLQLLGAGGELLTGYALFERVGRALPLCWPAGLATWIPGVAGLGHSRFPGNTLNPPPGRIAERERTLVKR